MRVSLFQVARVDPLCFVPAYLAGGLWLIVLVIVPVARYQGGPLDEWGKATAFVVLVSLTAMLVCWLRARRVEEILATGERIEARLERQLVHQHWAHLWVRYEHQGVETARKLFRVASKKIASLEGRETVTLVVSPAHPRSLIVLELFE